MENDPQAKPRLSRLAVASFIMACVGVVSLFLFFRACLEPIGWLSFLFVPLATILGFTAIWQICRSQGAISGRSFALIGILLNPIAFILFLAMIRFYHPHPYANKTSCLNNLKQLGTAIRMYCNDYDNHYPLQERWNEAVIPYIKNEKILVCTEIQDRNLTPSYAVNRKLAGLSEEDVVDWDGKVLIFESVQGKSLSGGSELFPSPPRHKDSHNLVLCDGHIRNVLISDISKLNWDPKHKPE